jgi:hypothetical protein
MIFHSHTHSMPVNDDLAITKSPLTQTFLQAALPQNTLLADIEAFELEEDDDDESKAHGKSIITHGIANNCLIFKCFDLVVTVSSYQKPILFYKSSQSYLEVFRI